MPIGTNSETVSFKGHAPTHVKHPLYYNTFDHTEPLRYGIFGHNGGVLFSRDGDLKLTIPKGAINIGDLVKLFAGTSLYGPFVLHSKRQSDVVSPYYWIGVSGSYHFQKAVQVEFEHFGACDPSHYQLFCCEDDDESYTMRPVDYELRFTERNDNTISLCKFQTYHFCSYCLSHACEDPVINTIGAYFLKPQKYSNHFTVEVWFSFPISYCLTRNEELYEKKGMVLDEDCSHIFEASSDINSTAYFVLDYNHNQGNDSWVMYHCDSGFKRIEVKQVTSYNIITDMQDLRAKEEKFLLPPRFIVNVRKKSISTCCEDLDINITVSLCNTSSGERKSAKFKLFVSVSAINNEIAKHDRLNPIGCQCKEINKPNLKELMKYSKIISSQWKRIALQLDVSVYKTDAIDKNHPNNIESKCDNMLQTWLQTTTSACWCQFIQALYTVGLNEVANEVRVHLQSSHDDNTTALLDGGRSSLKIEEDTLNLYHLLKHLGKIPDHNFHIVLSLVSFIKI